MLTFQDFEQYGENGKAAFIVKAIDEFKTTPFYKNAIDAQAYYRGDNTTILKRKNFIFDERGAMVEDITKANNLVPTNFLEFIVTQEASTLLSNGVKTSEEIRKGLGGNKFDILLMKAGIYALVDGVAWAYNYINEKGIFATDLWRGTELVPLFDESNGVLRAGIRFYQIDKDKPIYIELFEEDGVTKYSISKDKDGNRKVNVREKKRAYNIKIASDIISERVIDEFNWTTLPITPLYANEIKRSVFTRAFKAKNDLYDIILSDFGNNLEDSKDVYWVIKNYNGQDLGEFLEMYKKYKAITVDENGSAENKTIEVPYEARKTALEMIERLIYKEAMALDTSALTGASLTTTAIKAATAALNNKVDKFEWQVSDFMEGVISLYLEWANKPNEEYTITFVRSGITNDKETIENLMLIRDEISDATFYKNLPYVENPEEEMMQAKVDGISKFKTEDVEENEV